MACLFRFQLPALAVAVIGCVNPAVEKTGEALQPITIGLGGGGGSSSMQSTGSLAVTSTGSGGFGGQGGAAQATSSGSGGFGTGAGGGGGRPAGCTEIKFLYPFEIPKPDQHANE